MKRRDRYEYALNYLKGNFPREEKPTIRHPSIADASVRYGLSQHQTRRIVAEMRRLYG